MVIGLPNVDGKPFVSDAANARFTDAFRIPPAEAEARVYTRFIATLKPLFKFDRP
jgi:hypothetical protein